MANTTKAEAKEKLVTIFIPKTEYEKEDVYVAVNDRNWLIKRGVQVQVPECVAEVIEHSQMMMDKLDEFNEKNEK